jgi:hypothetical protein
LSRLRRQLDFIGQPNFPYGPDSSPGVRPVRVGG